MIKNKALDTMSFQQPRSRRFGFSLAELLVVLLILGEIATFSIPKLLSSQQEQRKKAVFRETLASLYDFLYSGNLRGDFSDGQAWEDPTRSLLLQRLNYISYVNLGYGSSLVGGCWNSGQGIRGFYMVLHNGACVAPMGPRWGANGQHAYSFGIDWNGNDGANTLGDDRIVVCLGIGNNYQGNPDCGGYARQNEIVLWNYAYGVNAQPLWNSIWQ